MKVIIVGAVQKLCPYRGEVDAGTVTLTFDVPSGDGPELHELAGHLGAVKDEAVSHENFTRDVLAAWSPHGLVRVESHWTTAELDVTCVAD